MFRAAIFDVDGLLIDSERAIMRLWLRATADLDRPMIESDYIPTIGRAAKESAALLIEREHLLPLAAECVWFQEGRTSFLLRASPVRTSQRFRRVFVWSAKEGTLF